MFTELYENYSLANLKKWFPSLDFTLCANEPEYIQNGTEYLRSYSEHKQIDLSDGD